MEEFEYIYLVVALKVFRNTKGNILFAAAKKKGNSQVTSGILVPPVLTKSPFSASVPQEEIGVNAVLVLVFVMQ